MSNTLSILGSGGVRTLSFDPPINLAALLRLHETGLELPCGGAGRCGKCRVRAAGALSQPSEREQALLGEAALADGWRLACLTQVLGDCQAEFGGLQGRILLEGLLPPIALDGAPGVGAAVDVGTTTVAAYLYQLEDGKRLATASLPNPQRAFGADVITRIDHALHGGGEALRAAILSCIETLLAQLARAAGLDLPLDRAVITGNTAMLYLLTGRSPASIAVAPFAQDHFFGEQLAGETLGLRGAAAVYLPRCLSAYVGADIACAMEACSLLDDAEAPSLLADIGTNGEMALYAGGKLLCCSTAAGPAFEGAGLSRGMTARDGAVSTVEYVDGSLRFDTIGGAPAQGFCGSGAVDLVAALLACGALDETGALQEEGHPFSAQIVQENGQAAFCLPGTKLLFTQADVRAIQLAKAAICAGLLTLLSEAGLRPEAVRKLYLAGGFGNCLRVSSASAIGLLPDALAQRAVSVGNAAGMGACMALLSRRSLEDMDALSRRARTVELSTHPVFMQEYIEQMFFPEA